MAIRRSAERLAEFAVFAAMLPGTIEWHQANGIKIIARS
jgi:hypothetical protein